MHVVLANNCEQYFEQAYTIYSDVKKQNSWSRSTFFTSLNSEFSLIAVDDAKNVIGYVAVSSVLDTLEIEDIAVTKSTRKQGIASSMLNKLITLATQANKETILLEVAENNLRAIALYEKYQFVLSGRRKNYYKVSNNKFADALLMDRNING